MSYRCSLAFGVWWTVVMPTACALAQEPAKPAKPAKPAATAKPAKPAPSAPPAKANPAADKPDAQTRTRAIHGGAFAVQRGPNEASAIAVNNGGRPDRDTAVLTLKPDISDPVLQDLLTKIRTAPFFLDVTQTTDHKRLIVFGPKDALAAAIALLGEQGAIEAPPAKRVVAKVPLDDIKARQTLPTILKETLPDLHFESPNDSVLLLMGTPEDVDLAKQIIYQLAGVPEDPNPKPVSAYYVYPLQYITSDEAIRAIQAAKLTVTVVQGARATSTTLQGKSPFANPKFTTLIAQDLTNPSASQTASSPTPASPSSSSVSAASATSAFVGTPGGAAIESLTLPPASRASLFEQRSAVRAQAGHFAARAAFARPPQLPRSPAPSPLPPSPAPPSVSVRLYLNSVLPDDARARLQKVMAALLSTVTFDPPDVDAILSTKDAGFLLTGTEGEIVTAVNSLTQEFLITSVTIYLKAYPPDDLPIRIARFKKALPSDVVLLQQEPSRWSLLVTGKQPDVTESAVAEAARKPDIDLIYKDPDTQPLDFAALQMRADMDQSTRQQILAFLQSPPFEFSPRNSMISAQGALVMVGPSDRVRDAVRYVQDRQWVDAGLPDTAGTPSVILSGNGQEIFQGIAFLDQEDVAPPQITIEARMLELTPEEIKRLGVTWNDRGFLAKTTFTEHPPVEHSGFKIGTITRDGFDAQAVIDSLLQNTQNRLIASPSVTVVNQQEAAIFIGDEVKFLATQSVDTQGHPVLALASQDVGINLLVNPTAHLEDNEVTMRLIPAVSTLIDFQPVPGGGVLPRVRTRRTDTTVRLKDGEMLAISGLLSDEEVRTMQKLPVLGDLPILGQIFRHQDNSRRRTELTVLISPRIVRRGVSITQPMIRQNPPPLLPASKPFPPDNGNPNVLAPQLSAILESLPLVNDARSTAAVDVVLANRHVPAPKQAIIHISSSDPKVVQFQPPDPTGKAPPTTLDRLDITLDAGEQDRAFTVVFNDVPEARTVRIIVSVEGGSQIAYTVRVRPRAAKPPTTK